MRNYPKTAKKPVVDTYFGTEVTDNYRWLEDDTSPETEAWVDEQIAFTNEYLSDLAIRSDIEPVVHKHLSQKKRMQAFIRGDYYYFSELDGDRPQPVLYRHKKGEQPQVFIDPNIFSEDGTSSLYHLSFSKTDKYVATLISDGGADWTRIEIIDVASGEIVDKAITDAKFTSVDFIGDDKFFYSRYPSINGSKLSQKTDQHQVWLHTIGTEQAQDQLVFGDAEKFRYVGVSLSDCGNYALFYGANDTSTNQLWIKPLDSLEQPARALSPADHARYSTIATTDTHILISTDAGAPKTHLIRIPFDGHTDTAEVVIAEADGVQDFAIAGELIIVETGTGTTTELALYHRDGSKAFDVEFANKGLIAASRSWKKESALMVSFQNHVTAHEYHELNLATGELTPYWQPAERLTGVVSKEVWFTSKDGTKVPMTICHKEGLELTGDHPTILYGYGGFNVPLLANYSPRTAAWVELGGVYVVANLRGGGEFGKDWHLAGTKLQKQNVFDDFIAAGENLIEQGYCSPKTLGIFGGSNGGLLVGACLLQRPDLFAAAVPAVGVLDMLRYHTFTAGAGWAYDYGTSEDSKEMFGYLYGYSPVHNVKESVDYPATMITTADHDDRVVPAHSFKFAAEMQAKQDGGYQSDKPRLIRIDKNAGHGAGKSLAMAVAETTDIFAFFKANMG